MYAPKSRSRKSTALCLSHHQHPERVGLEVAKCSPTLVQLPALFSTFNPSYNPSDIQSISSCSTQQRDSFCRNRLAHLSRR